MKKYFRHKIEKLIVIDGIITVHYFEFPKNFNTKGEAHDFWELVYADKESIRCTSDEATIDLDEGEMLFHKPNEFHSLSANGKKAPNVFIVSFSCKSEAMGFYAQKKLRLEPQFKKYIYSILEEAKKTFNMPYSDPDIKKLPLLEAPTLGGIQLIKNYLEILLIEIMRSLTETDKGNKTFVSDVELGDKTVREIIAFLQRNVENSIDVDDVCTAVGYGRSQVFKTFRRATGKGIMEYFSALKIERAKQLLREKELSVKQIAELLSYDTPNYFSKTFRKFTGATPTAYAGRYFAQKK